MFFSWILEAGMDGAVMTAVTVSVIQKEKEICCQLVQCLKLFTILASKTKCIYVVYSYGYNLSYKLRVPNM